MAQVTMLACDQCKNTPAETWQIAQIGQHIQLVDLCQACSKPIRALVTLGRDDPTGLPQRKRFRKTPLPPQAYA